MPEIEPIDQEISDLKETKGPYVLNNLDGFLAGGYKRWLWETGDLAENAFAEEEESSELLKSKTATEFFQDCDEATTRAGYTPEQVIEARESLFKKRTEYKIGEKTFKTFNEFLFPIYRELRLMGYSYWDLTA